MVITVLGLVSAVLGVVTAIITAFGH